jgi:hypothetical protein
MAPVTERRRDFDWYLTITLAGINGLVLCAALVINILDLISGGDFAVGPPRNEPITVVYAMLGMFVVVCLFWFWIRMLTDYFRARPESHSVAWGWALVILNLWAALAYFWFVWKPRNRPTVSAHN